MEDTKENMSVRSCDVKHDENEVAEGITMPGNLAILSDDEYHRLGRKATIKMDCIIMPTLVIMYILNYLDRQSIASAKLADITVDLNLSEVQYQTSVSILFCSYSMYKTLPLVFDEIN